MRRLVITLLVLAGLLVAADFGAAALAESAVSRQMREQIGLVDDPSVRINGFPFLTQAISGDYGSVDVDAERIAVGQLRELTVAARLRDVRAPLPMLLGSGPKTLQVAEADGSVWIPAADLARQLPDVTDLRVERIDESALEQAVDDGGDDELTAIDPESAVRMVGTTPVRGEPTEVSVIAVLELVDGAARIVPRDVRIGGPDARPLPAVATTAVAELFAVRVDAGNLPLQVTPTALRERDGGLEISGTATDLTLG